MPNPDSKAYFGDTQPCTIIPEFIPGKPPAAYAKFDVAALGLPGYSTNRVNAGVLYP
jgi:hypothetical protein